MAGGRQTLGAGRPWTHLLAVALIALSLAPVLLYAGLQGYRDADTVGSGNDGRKASFFTFYTEPYYTFAEDFHLYTLRAKRIRDRGWRDDLFDAEGAGPAAPSNYLQYLIGRMLLATGGAPSGHAGVLFALTLASALLLYGTLQASQRDPLGWVGAVFVVVFYLAMPKYAALFDFVRPWLEPVEPTVWPGFRMSRAATFAWSAGAFAALLVLVARLAVEGGGRRWQLAVAGLLLLFALGDVWSFALAVGIVVSGLAWRLGAVLLASGSPRRWVREMAVLLLAGLAVVASFRLLNGHASADLLGRSGLGPEWRESGVSLSRLDGWFTGFLVRTGFLALPLAGLFLVLRGWRRPAVFLIAGFSLSGLAAVLVGAALFGAHTYQMTQFYDRAETGLTLSLLLALALAVRDAPGPADGTRAPRRLAGALALAAVVAYAGLSALRTDLYIRQVMARYAALPARFEALRPVLTCLSARGLATRIATLSPELNHLAAFWTDADMAMPVGFPLHSRRPSGEIEARMAALLQLYRVPVAAWRAFPVNAQGDSTVSWHRSRLLAARQGYIYFLFHYGGSIDHAARVEAIARRLDERRRGNRPPPRPGLILEDEVSAALGRPDLGGYARLWARDDLTLWIGQSDADAAQACALR